MSEKRKKVSVIIPVYNVEPYLERCIKSIEEQTYDNIEIILVDDGSVDNSGNICDLHAARDHRINVIHKANGGVSAARRDGVRAAVGEYVTFVDADDMIIPDYVEHFVFQIRDADLCTGGCHKVRVNGDEFDEKDGFDEGLYSSRDEMAFIYKFMMYHPWSYLNRGVLPYMCAKLYKRDLATKIIETSDFRLKYSEDWEFLCRYILNCSSIVITHDPVYIYLQREGSATVSRMSGYLENLGYLYNSLYEIFSKHEMHKELMFQLENFVLLRLKMTPGFLHFMPENQFRKFGFPFCGEFTGKNIILYGAGRVGVDYYRTITDLKEFQLMKWVDKDADQKSYPSIPEITKPQSIMDTDYDAVIIALSEKYHEEVEKELINMGVPKEKIFWRKPLPCFF